MNNDVREIRFALRCQALPKTLYELPRELGCCASTRQTEEFPIWWRIDGNGYTLWLSGIRLSNSSVIPPAWELKLETLATLPLEGQERWDETIEVIKELLENEKIGSILEEGLNGDA